MRAVEDMACFLLLFQKGDTHDPAPTPKKGSTGVKEKILRVLELRPSGSDSSVTPAKINLVSFPKVLVSSVSGTLLNMPSGEGYAEQCSQLSTRHLINKSKGILRKQK